MKQIKQIALNDGTTIPQIGFGTWQLEDTTEIAHAMQHMYAAGYRHIDTAQIYNNEYQIGNFLATIPHVEQAMYLTTKVWISNFTSRENLMQSIHQSLKRLGVKKVNLILLHWALSEQVSNQAYKWLEEAKDAGLTNSIGVSNFNIKRLTSLLKVAKHKPVVNQIQFDLINQQQDLIAFCHRHDIQVEGYSLIRPYINTSSRQTMSAAQKAIVDKIGQKYNKTGPQVILRYALQKGLIIFPKSRNATRIKTNIELDDFELSAEDMQTLAKMSEVKVQKMDEVAEDHIWDNMTQYPLLYRYNFKIVDKETYQITDDDSRKSDRTI